MADPVIYQSEFIAVRKGNHHPYIDINVPCVSFAELYNELQDAKVAIKLAESNQIQKEIRNTIFLLVNFDNGLQLVDEFTGALSRILNLSKLKHELAEMSDSTLAEVESIITNFTLSNWTEASEIGGHYYRFDTYSDQLLCMPISSNENEINFGDMGAVENFAFNEEDLKKFLSEISAKLNLNITKKHLG